MNKKQLEAFQKVLGQLMLDNGLTTKKDLGVFFENAIKDPGKSDKSTINKGGRIFLHPSIREIFILSAIFDSQELLEVTGLNVDAEKSNKDKFAQIMSMNISDERKADLLEKL